jgi:hypothetical protein
MLLSGPDLFHVPATPNTPFECTDLRLAMEPHVRGDRPYLGFVDGTAPVVMVQTTIDGMYPIEASGANPVVITAQSATQTGFAIEIHFDRATSGIDVTGFPAPQDGELLVQDAGGNTFIVWFPDSLDVGPTVTITPR